MLIIKIRTSKTHTFVLGSKYTLQHQTNHFDTFSAKYIGKSRIDGIDMFQFLPSDAKHPIINYLINNDVITEVTVVTPLEDQLWGFKDSSYQKNSSILLEYCMDHYNLNKGDLGDDEKFKPMMREIILNGLLPKE